MKKKAENTELVARAQTTMDIAHEIKAAVDSIIEAHGEVSEETFAALQQWQAALSVKAENIGHVQKRMDGEIDYYRAVEEAARGRRKVLEAAQDGLKKYLRDAMLTADTKSVKGDLFTFTVSDGRERVEIDDYSQLPYEMTEIQEVVKPRTDAIKTALKDGRAVPGARLEYGEPFLTIRTAKG